MIRAAASVVVLVAAVSVTAACGGEAPLRGPGRSHDALPTLSISQRLGTRIGPPQMSGAVIVYPATSGRGTAWNEVIAMNPTTGRKRVAARTRFADGMINWVARTGSWTVYVDQSRQLSDAHPTTAWQLVARDDATRRTRVLDSSSGELTGYVPRLRSQGGAVLWSSITLDGQHALWWWRPSWSGPRRLVAGVDIDPATASIDEESVVFHAPPPHAGANPGNAGECWRARTSGGRPAAVTHTGGLVLDCSAGDGWLVWRQSRQPTDPAAEDVDVETPYELWAQHRAGRPVLIHRGVMPYTYPYTAGGMLLWMENDEQVVLERLSNPRSARRLQRHFVRFDPFGDEHYIGFVSERFNKYVDTAHLIALPDSGIAPRGGVPASWHSWCVDVVELSRTR